MKKGIYIFLAIGLLTAVIFFFRSAKGITGAGPAPAPEAKLFNSYCAPCHGELGKADGPLAYLVYPKPRDFTRGVFKLRSTPSGEAPTDQDLVATIRNGLPGTAMPSFYFLKEEEIGSLAAYVKQLFENSKSEFSAYSGPPTSAVL
jgi:cytochrome c oxidase cbb3-type subunit 2